MDPTRLSHSSTDLSMVAMMVDMMRSSVVVVPDAEDAHVEEDDELYVGIEPQTTSEFPGVLSRDDGPIFADGIGTSTLFDDCYLQSLYSTLLVGTTSFCTKLSSANFSFHTCQR
jgi:hypothetical protein